MLTLSFPMEQRTNQNITTKHCSSRSSQIFWPSVICLSCEIIHFHHYKIKGEIAKRTKSNINYTYCRYITYENLQLHFAGNCKALSPIPGMSRTISAATKSKLQKSIVDIQNNKYPCFVVANNKTRLTIKESQVES